MTPGPAPSGSVFLGKPTLSTSLAFGKRLSAPALRPSRHRRDQKTFSAGPRSFNAKELWFPGSIAASRVQPIADSRHGRIACKASCIAAFFRSSARRAAASNQTKGLGCPTPSLVDGGFPQFNVGSSFASNLHESRRLQSN